MEELRRYRQWLGEVIRLTLRHNPHLLAQRFPFSAGKDGGREGEQAEIRPVYGAFRSLKK